MFPVVVTLVVIVRPQWFPTGDMAQAELHVRGFPSHPPFVGAAGRIQSESGVQGSHPGPGLWLAMWPIYVLLGSSSAALLVSVVSVHLVTATLGLWLVAQRAGTGAAVALAAGLAVVVRAGGPEVFTEPWNPWMALLPFLVFVLACWSVLDDDVWAAPLAVLAGSYSIQAHIGYVLVVGGLVVFTLVALIRRLWTADRADRVPSARWVGVAAAAGVMAWMPPIIDQFRRSPGNITILRESFGNPDAPSYAFGEVAEIVVVQLNLAGPWVIGPGRQDLTWWAIGGFVGMLALWAGGVWAARASATLLRLHALLGAAWLLAIASLTRLFGTYFEYTVRWLWLLAMLVAVVSAVSLGRLVATTYPAICSRAERWGVAGIAVVAVVGTLQFVGRAEPTGFRDGLVVGGLAPQALERLDPGERYLLRWWDPAALGATGFGMVLELERHGYTVGVDPQFAAAALPHRVQPEASATAVLYLVLGDASIAAARTHPELVEVAEFDVRSAAERERSETVRAAIERGLTAAGQADRIPLLDAFYGQAQLLFNEPGPPPGVAEMLGEYIELGQPAVLFRAAPGDEILPL